MRRDRGRPDNRRREAIRRAFEPYTVQKPEKLTEIARKTSRPVSRVLSRTIIPLESPSPATSSGLPGSTRGHALPLAWRLPYLALLQVGFTVPPGVATGAVRSYRTVSPLPSPLLALGRFAFCCTFRRLTPPRSYLAPRPQEPGLSSTSREKCSDRPADSARTIAAWGSRYKLSAGAIICARPRRRAPGHGNTRHCVSHR